MAGLRGRPRKPTNMRIVDGNAGKRPLPKDEPKPRLGVPEKPAHIADDPTASAEWDRIVGLTTSKKARVLTVADGPMLEATCLAYARMRLADRELAAGEGLTYESTTQGGGIIRRPRPETAISNQARRDWVACLTHFGLSPATRGKVQTVDEETDADPAEAHFS